MHEHLIAGGTIRKLAIGEASLYAPHLLRLDPESRRNRFGGAVSDAYLRGYAQPSNLVGAAMHGFFVGGVLRGIAELRPLPRDEAETALSVEKQWQGRGVGAALLARTLVTARSRGTKLLHIACLAENRRMQRLARKFNADLKVTAGGVMGTLALPARLLKAA